MIDFDSAQAALKSLYLGVLTEQLNTKVNPLLAKIEQTSNDVWGKEIIKLVSFGLNGGVGAGTETGALPTIGSNKYEQFVLSLKNFYGRIEISDKAIRASQNNAGAFVNLLNAEMDGLLKASKYNFGRMLYGNGSGMLSTVVADETQTDYSIIKVADTTPFIEGMIIDIATTSGTITTAGKNRRIINVDADASTVQINSTPSTAFANGCAIYQQNSKDSELTGLGAIFDVANITSLYGLTRADYSFMTPYIDSTSTLALTNIQNAIDNIEEVAGGVADFIVGSYAMRRSYVGLCSNKITNTDYLNLDGGFKALSYAGVPFVADRFCGENDIYVLNTKDFKLHQLCDWRWLEAEGGNILKQSATAPTYTATLVKYADLLCERPCGQAKISLSA
jgi:hypothetical protein